MITRGSAYFSTDHISAAATKIRTSRGKVVVPREKKRQKEMVTSCPRVGGE